MDAETETYIREEARYEWEQDMLSEAKEQWKKDNIQWLMEEFCESNDNFNEFVTEMFMKSGGE